MCSKTMILNHADKRKMGDDNPKKVRSVAIRGTYIGTKTRFEKRRWQNSSQSVDIPPISTPAKKIEDYKINNHETSCLLLTTVKLWTSYTLYLDATSL